MANFPAFGRVLIEAAFVSAAGGLVFVFVFSPVSEWYSGGVLTLGDDVVGGVQTRVVSDGRFDLRQQDSRSRQKGQACETCSCN